MNTNVNSKFLNEARELEARWQKTGLLTGISDRFIRGSCAVLLESQRFRYECESDDEYEEYLENFNARMRHALGKTSYNNYWLGRKRNG